MTWVFLIVTVVLWVGFIGPDSMLARWRRSSAASAPGPTSPGWERRRRAGRAARNGIDAQERAARSTLRAGSADVEPLGSADPPVIAYWWFER
jgi:hypothetical protein